MTCCPDMVRTLDTQRPPQKKPGSGGAGSPAANLFTNRGVIRGFLRDRAGDGTLRFGQPRMRSSSRWCWTGSTAVARLYTTPERVVAEYDSLALHGGVFGARRPSSSTSGLKGRASSAGIAAFSYFRRRRCCASRASSNYADVCRQAWFTACQARSAARWLRPRRDHITIQHRSRTLQWLAWSVTIFAASRWSARPLLRASRRSTGRRSFTSSRSSCIRAS